MMRGLLTFFTREDDFGRYRTALLVLSADPEIAELAIRSARIRFPNLQWTFVVPRAYGKLFSCGADVYWIDEAKAMPVRFLRKLRRRKFDICIVVCPGRPSFRKPKIAALLTNAQRTVIYNELDEFIPVDRSQWRALIIQCASRMARLLRLLLLPFGLVYLLVRTLQLQLRMSRIARRETA